MEISKSNYDMQVDIGKRIFLEYDQERLIRKFCLDADTRYIYLTYLNAPCRVNPTSTNTMRSSSYDFIISKVASLEPSS